MNLGHRDVESIGRKMGSMKRRLTDQQIISMIREQEAGLKIADEMVKREGKHPIAEDEL